jgi:hypothetical protein
VLESRPMVRREEAEGWRCWPTVSRCPFPAGASPASVSAGAPSSRPQALEEISVAQAGCQKPPRRKPARGRQHEVKPAASIDLQSESRAAHFRVKATSSASESGEVHAEDLGGVQGAARVQGDERNTRGPSAQPQSRQSGSYKPKAKSSRVQRESEGVVVLMNTVSNNAVGGKGPYSGPVDGVATCEGMTGKTGSNLPAGLRPNDKARHPQHQLGSQPSNARVARPGRRSSLRPDTLAMPPGVGRTCSVRVMLRSEWTTGKPCAGNPQARFERGSYPHPGWFPAWRQ